MADYLERGQDSDDFLYLSAVVAAADSHRQFLLGNALAAGGKLDDAIQKFREVIRLKPEKHSGQNAGAGLSGSNTR